MTDITLLNTKFETAGKVESSLDLSPEAINVPVVHQVVKAILAGRRQGTACTKNKALVSGGGKKPFKQKGTGNARQGSKRSPLMPGGGTVFGPTPRSYEQKVNKKVMVLAVRSLLADKFQAGKLLVLEKFPELTKTKEVSKLLSSKGLESSLLVTSDLNDPIIRSARNLRKSKAVSASGFSVYEALKHENLIMDKRSFELLSQKGE